MAFIYSDPNTAGPFSTFQVKDSLCKAVRLTNANFGTTAVNTLVTCLPSDATIIGFTYWNKTILSGGGITAATIAVGTSSGGTQFSVANAAPFSASGTYGILSPVVNIFQAYNPPYTAGDMQIWVSGAATTGIPTAGEFYLLINYVR